MKYIAVVIAFLFVPLAAHAADEFNPKFDNIKKSIDELKSSPPRGQAPEKINLPGGWSVQQYALTQFEGGIASRYVDYFVVSGKGVKPFRVPGQFRQDGCQIREENGYIIADFNDQRVAPVGGSYFVLRSKVAGSANPNEPSIEVEAVADFATHYAVSIANPPVTPGEITTIDVFFHGTNEPSGFADRLKTAIQRGPAKQWYSETELTTAFMAASQSFIKRGLIDSARNGYLRIYKMDMDAWLIKSNRDSIAEFMNVKGLGFTTVRIKDWGTAQFDINSVY